MGLKLPDNLLSKPDHVQKLYMDLKDVSDFVETPEFNEFKNRYLKLNNYVTSALNNDETISEHSPSVTNRIKRLKILERNAMQTVITSYQDLILIMKELISDEEYNQMLKEKESD